MGNPEFKIQDERDEAKNGLGLKLALGRQMSEEENQKVFSMAVGYASELMVEKSKTISGYPDKGDKVKKHTGVIALDRIVAAHSAGVESYRFLELKRTVCNELEIDLTTLSDERLHNFLSNHLDAYFGKELEPEVNSNMERISSFVNRVFSEEK